MKLKKNKLIIIFVIVIILVALGAFFLKEKGFNETEVKSKTYKEVNLKNGQCVQESDLNGSNIIYGPNNGRAIIEGTETNIGWTGLVYLIKTENGYCSTCVHSSDIKQGGTTCNADGYSFIEGWPNIVGKLTDAEVNQILDRIKSYLNNTYGDNASTYNFFAEEYSYLYDDLNRHGFNNLGDKVPEKELPTPTCSYVFKDAYNGTPSLQIDGADGAIGNDTESWINTYVEKCGCPPAGFAKNTTVLNTLTNERNSCLNFEEEGYHTHTVTDSNNNSVTNCYENGIWKNKGECAIECTNEEKQRILNSNNVTDAQKFNSLCKEDIETVNIILDWQGGWGPGTLGDNWSGSDGIYKSTGIKGKSITFNFDSELQYYGYKLIGWATSPDCVSKFVAGGKVHTFNNVTEDTTYYACYEDGFLKDSIFSGSNKKTYNNVLEKYEVNRCNDEKITNGGISTIPMTQMSKYIRKDTDTISTAGNSYCNVLCTDTIDVKYPNIFMTIPAGQNFEFLYEPEITGSRICQSEFNYNSWSQAYDAAITAELQALDAYQKNEKLYNLASGLSPSAKTKCGCAFSDDKGNCISPIYTYSDQASYKYTNAATGRPETLNVMVSGCGESAAIENKKTTVTGYENNRDTLKNNYKKAVKERIGLEKDNLQCYTILDSDKNASDEISNSDVFPNNYEIVNELKPKYKTSTSKVSVKTDATSTSTYSNYINSIDSSIQQNLSTSGVISTKGFYELYPKLTFYYDDGSGGSPVATAGNFRVSTKSNVDTLLKESLVKQDTGSYTNVENGVYAKNSGTTLVGKVFSFDKGDSTTSREQISFNAYGNGNTQKTYREVKYYYTFHEGEEYCGNYQTGDYEKSDNTSVTSSKCNKTEKKTSLSKLTPYYNGESTAVFAELYNHTYPVSLKAISSINKNSKEKYQVGFVLEDEEGSTLKNFDINNGAFNYTCEYDISNDALITPNNSDDYKDLKSSTIFRPIATNDIDPNDRASTGNLGENWTNAKGKAAIESINKEYGNGTKINDTYNPKNLEYSFTLTPSLIAAIKSYNEAPDRSYDDFNLQCATDDGRECTSSFLDDLVEGKVDGTVIQNNYAKINNWNKDKLRDIRQKWKYYYSNNTGQTPTIQTTTSLSLNDYLSHYRKWGVLP